MQKILLLILLLLFKSSVAQLNENFDAPDFTLNPQWSGDTAFWHINPLGQLQSKKSAIPQTIMLITPQTQATNIQWEFWLKLSFDPSANNLVRVYLTTDQENIREALNGYYLEIGRSGSNDSYDLYRQTGTRSTLIAQTPPITRKQPSALLSRIRITRDINGEWIIYSDEEGGYNFVKHTSVTDNTHTINKAFGLWAKYTTTRSDQFFFDDILIEPLKGDQTPPIISSVIPVDSLTLQLTFNKPVDSASVINISNYSLKNAEGLLIIDHVSKESNRWYLHTRSALKTGEYQLTVKDIKDTDQHIMLEEQLLAFQYLQLHQALPGEIVINEIYADFNPKVALPEAKFIELWNRTKSYISLENWTYSKKNSRYKFGKETIGPGEYLILCAKADTGLFQTYGKTVGLSPWPSPNVAGDELTLADENGQIIHQVNYTTTWYKDNIKNKGGWSLELMDAWSPCNGPSIWMASIDPRGGTPGNQNSVFKANHGESHLKLSQASADLSQLALIFNHTVDSLSASNVNAYTVNNGIGRPKSVSFLSNDNRAVLLEFEKPFQEGLLYRLKCENVMDCAGRTIDITGNELEFMLASPISKDDIVVNEILFNPRIQGADFVEIYNRSGKIVDLKTLSIASLDEKKDSLKSIRKISDSTFLFYPDSYIVLTKDPENIRSNYYCENPEAFIQMSLPAFNNDKGVVVLLSDSKIIDQVNYSENMHLQLLKNIKGVSLERVDANIPGNAHGNFQSAAASEGYATPTYKNSQAQNTDTKEEIRLADKVFSPDRDGFQDLLKITYSFNRPGIIANINIYNDKGYLVKKLISNMTMAQSGEISWDGLNDQDQIAPIGIYVLHAEIFDLQGSVKKYLKSFVVAGKLN
jgi:hypothetical protein